ncbi:MAG: uroporphyrinogen-III C-methyltransferase [Rubrivivax sp.]
MRAAQQQAAITGGSEPLLLVPRQAEERLARYGQPRLERVRRAVVQDLNAQRRGRHRHPLLTSRIDEVVRQVDELPLLVQPQHAAAMTAQSRRRGRRWRSGHRGRAAALPRQRRSAAAAAGSSAAANTSPLETLRASVDRLVAQVWSETRSLVRVTRIADPEAMPSRRSRAYFPRENVKLRLLNARLALLSRQFDIAQSDLREAREAIERYFDRNARCRTRRRRRAAAVADAGAQRGAAAARRDAGGDCRGLGRALSAATRFPKQATTMRGLIWVVVLFAVAALAAATFGRNDGLVSIFLGRLAHRPLAQLSSSRRWPRACWS